jgi:hypothetical protein
LKVWKKAQALSNGDWSLVFSTLLVFFSFFPFLLLFLFFFSSYFSSLSLPLLLPPSLVFIHLQVLPTGITKARSFSPHRSYSSPLALHFARERKNNHHRKDKGEVGALSGTPPTQALLVLVATTVALVVGRSTKMPTLFFLPFFFPFEKGN